MGGSLSLALKREFPKVSVWGYARSRKSYLKLKRLRAVNKVERDLGKVVKDADWVILGLPVEAIVDHLKRIVFFLKKGAVVFDLGSSKRSVEKAAHKYLPRDVGFVGCHPLCGSEKSGAEFGRRSLYEGALCLITSSPRKAATKTVKKMWEKLGSRVVFVNFDLHDKILSSVSHLPHLVSFALTRLVPEGHLKFCPQSFKDLTRVSKSPPSVWGDIFMSNRKNILNDTQRFIKILGKFRRLLEQGRKKEIIDFIAKVNRKQKILAP